jgi:hypothetical protein
VRTEAVGAPPHLFGHGRRHEPEDAPGGRPGNCRAKRWNVNVRLRDVFDLKCIAAGVGVLEHGVREQPLGGDDG